MRHTEEEKRHALRVLKGRYKQLDDLTARLQEEFNGDADFISDEQDRLTTYDLCELLQLFIDAYEDENADFKDILIDYFTMDM